MTIAQQRQQKIADFYTQHAGSLHRAVARRVDAPAAMIEDACQAAWTTLLRRPDIDLDHRGLKWLATVAVRDAWRQASVAREIPAGAFLLGDGDEPGTRPEPPAATSDPADRAVDRAVDRDQHDQRVADLAVLRPRERRELYLHALGHSYHEIAALTDSRYTAVNRRISEGRAQLRKLARERARGEPHA